jgi:hypothetical protein
MKTNDFVSETLINYTRSEQNARAMREFPENTQSLPPVLIRGLRIVDYDWRRTSAQRIQGFLESRGAFQTPIPACEDSLPPDSMLVIA